jgi:hypothetical protein
MDTAESQDRVLGLMLDESTDQSGKKVLLQQVIPALLPGGAVRDQILGRARSR